MQNRHQSRFDTLEYCRVGFTSTITDFLEINCRVSYQLLSRRIGSYVESTSVYSACWTRHHPMYTNSELYIFHYWVWQYLKKTRRDDETLHRLGNRGDDDTQFCDSGHWVCNISDHLQHGMVPSNTQKIISFSNSCPQTHVWRIHNKANYYSSKCSLWYWLPWLTKVCGSICSAGKDQSSI